MSMVMESIGVLRKIFWDPAGSIAVVHVKFSYGSLAAILVFLFVGEAISGYFGRNRRVESLRGLEVFAVLRRPAVATVPLAAKRGMVQRPAQILLPSSSGLSFFLLS
jgi:hypothetical protein